LRTVLKPLLNVKDRMFITLAGGPAGTAAVQNLGYAVWDLQDQAELSRGRLPLPPGATLTWLGFTEEVRRHTLHCAV
jgi:hypothetical protein